MSTHCPYLVIGAGPAGLGAARALRERGCQAVVLESGATYGGLCGSFTLRGFTFDRFVHLSFASDPRVAALFAASAGEVTTHTPNPHNLYHGLWIKHPAQNNLFPLPEREKERIIDGFRRRPAAPSGIADYEQWLRAQFGDRFAELFPMPYTRKYWMAEARELETRWVGERIYQPSMDEVLRGARTSDTPVTYYAKQMRYPTRGGYRRFLSAMAAEADVRYGREVTAIDPARREVTTAAGETFTYGRLISTLPLPEYPRLLPAMPSEVAEAAGRLRHTSGYHISVALKTQRIPPYLWWYIYDEDILAARAYSPSLKAAANAPAGCSSLQLEVYCREGEHTAAELLEGTVGRLAALGVIHREDILFTHTAFEPYANVTFTPGIYSDRAAVRRHLRAMGIATAGRFGEWDYLWSDQSLLSGMAAAQDG